MREIYFVSGLGADQRVFQFLKFEGYQPRHIYWLKPKPSESMAEYAQRLTQQIDSERPVLVGLSFGGMMAVEIAKLIETERVIIISSAKSKAEIPPYVKLLKVFPLHKLVPIKVVNRFGLWFMKWFFGTQSQQQGTLLSNILLDTDDDFLKWAVDQVLDWRNTDAPDNLYHIHGTADRVLPIRFAQDVDQVIEEGGHFMVVNYAVLITALLEDVIG